MKKYEHVDALRAIAVLLVVMVHAGLRVPLMLGGESLSAYGQYGVQLFFVMSAFTLCHSLKKVTVLDRTEYLAFMTRRFFRIAPLYYLAIPFYFLFSWTWFRLYQSTPFTLPSDYTWKSVAANFAFLHGLYPPGNNNIVPGGWSIGSEFLFYAGFPILFVWVARNKWFLGIAAAAAAFATLGMLLLMQHFGFRGQGGNGSFAYFFISNQLPCFLLGIAYFHFGKTPLFRRLILALTLPALVGLVVAHETFWGWLFAPMAAGLLSVSAALALENRPIPHLLRRIGEASFSIYITHFFIAWTLGYSLPQIVPASWLGNTAAIALFVLVSALSFGVALLTNIFVERPFIDLGHRLAEKIRTKPVPCILVQN